MKKLNRKNLLIVGFFLVTALVIYTYRSKENQSSTETIVSEGSKVVGSEVIGSEAIRTPNSVKSEVIATKDAILNKSSGDHLRHAHSDIGDCSLAVDSGTVDSKSISEDEKFKIYSNLNLLPEDVLKQRKELLVISESKNESEEFDAQVVEDMPDPKQIGVGSIIEDESIL